MTEDASILHYFTRVGVFDDGQVSAGMTYLDWQHAYRSETGYRTMKFDQRSNGSLGEDKRSKYAHLVRRLGLLNQHAVEEALRMFPVSRAEQGAIHGHRHRFIKAFDRLSGTIMAANDAIKAAEENINNS